MSTFPGPILVRLQELKLWQGNYDSIMQSKSRDNTNFSDYETIEGLSALDTTRSSSSSPIQDNLDWDRKEISPTKPFEQLLEEKLAEESDPVEVRAKPKRPFLKKGSGLDRYRLKSVPSLTRKSCCKKDELRLDKPITKQSSRRSKSVRVKSPKEEKFNEITPLKIPDLVIKPKATWHNVKENDGVSEKSPETFCGPKENINGRKSLEKNYANIDRLMSNPFNSDILEKINEYTIKRDSPKKSSNNKFIINKTTRTIMQDLETLPHHHGEQSFYEKALEKELQIFEALEERAENSSFCSTNSSIIKLLSSTPNKVIHRPIVKSPIPEERPASDRIEGDKCMDLHRKLNQVHTKTEFLNNFMNKLRKISDIRLSKRSRNNSNNSNTDKTLTNITDLSFSDDEKWSDKTRSHSHSPTNTDGSSDYESTDIVDKTDVAVNTSFSELNGATQTDRLVCTNCELLEEKLLRYAKEIPDIEHEKAKICDFVKELERKRDQLNKEMNKMKKRHEEEIVEVRHELQTERKRFAKEKMVFETYIKDSQNRPSKKEREEISYLKKELADVQELLKLKETKNGASQARLRNQIKQLEKENCELKGDVQKLTKENAKLSANQKLSRRPSDTKMLHEINKNLTKLTEEAFKKQKNIASDLKENQTAAEKEHGNWDSFATMQDSKSSKASKRSLSRSSNDYVIPVNDSSGLDITNFVNLSLEKQYEHVFGQFNSPGDRNNSLNDSKKERIELLHEDGSKEIKYGNGNIKTISPDGNQVVVKYYNGDIKETNLSERILKYYYATSSTWHTQFQDGSELIAFSNGQSERKYKDGRCEINYPDGVVQVIMPDGTERANYPDGSVLTIDSTGERVLHLPNGQKEIHTKDQKRREYPDGTVKILYPDGSQETRYPNGRIRMKNANGVLTLDTDNPILVN